MTTGYLDLGDGKLYYEVSDGGDQQETLVLSHAAFLDSRMWDDQWDVFAGRYQVIRYDMRGYGKSDPASGPRTRRHDLYRLLQHLNIARAHLLGCSMGGEIVIDLALEHPELAESLIVVNSTPSGFELQGEPPPVLLEMLAAMQQGDIERTSELQLRIWVDGPHRQPDEVDRQVRQRASAMNRLFVANGTWAIADLQPFNPLDPPAARRLREIQAPTLIVSGSLDYAETLRAADVMAAAIPNAKRVMIPDTAHVPNMEQPALFNRVVLDFLASR
jgi:pimeloyl-ACP methyl ester carboxylesterase